MKKARFSFIGNLLTKRNVVGVLVLYVLTVWLPSIGIVIFSPAGEKHRLFVAISHWVFGGVILVPILCHLKIEADMEEKDMERAWDILLFFLIWAALGIMFFLCLPILLIIAVLFFLFGKKQKVSDFIICLLSWGAVFIKGIQLKVYGKVPKAVRIFVVNHESSADYFVWPALLGFILSKIVAGSNLKKFPVFSWFMSLKCILVTRGDSASVKQMLEEVKQALEKKSSIVIAPEKGRKRISDRRFMADFYRGAFVTACETHVPISPMLTIGTGEYKPPTKKEPAAKNIWKFQWYASPGRVTCLHLPDIFPGDMSPEKLARKVRCIMVQAKAVHLALVTGKITEEQYERIIMWKPEIAPTTSVI